jgi:hypothetical protein
LEKNKAQVVDDFHWSLHPCSQLVRIHFFTLRTKKYAWNQPNTSLALHMYAGALRDVNVDVNEWTGEIEIAKETREMATNITLFCSIFCNRQCQKSFQ